MATATYVPSPPEELPEALGALERFLHEQNYLPALIRIGLAHAQFETIHPFLDGNGLVGRRLITFLLTEKGNLQKPVLYLSHHFKQHRQAYYDHLQAVRVEGDWEGWLAFFLRGVAEVCQEASLTAQRILALREQHRTLITDHLGRAAANGHRVLESLFERPIVSVNAIEALIATTYPAANNLVGRLEALGILREMTGQKRHRRFCYQPYIELFGDAPQELVA